MKQRKKHANKRHTAARLQSSALRTAAGTAGGAKMTKRLRPGASSSSAGYSSAETCPWPAFEAGLVRKDYSAFASQEQFMNVYTEYVDALNGGKETPVSRQIFTIQRLKSRIFRLSGVMAQIRELEQTIGIAYIPQLIDILRADFPRLKFAWPNDSFEADLCRVDALLKSDMTRMQALEADLYKQHEGGKESTHETFLNNFAELSKFQGYAIRPEQCTVLDYCIHMRRLIEHNERMEAEIKKMKHGANRR